MIKSISMLVLCLMFLSACAVKKQEVPKERLAKRASVPSSTNSAKIQVDISALPPFNHYLLRVEVPKVYGDLRIQLNGEWLFPDSNGDFSSHLLGGTPYEVRIFQKIKGEWEENHFLSEGLSGVIPKDLMLQGNLILREPTTLTAPRIFLDTHLKLLTNGNNLELHTNELIALNDSHNLPSIETFPLGATAEQMEGLSAGIIRIVATSAQGNMILTMRGQNGSDGLPGLDRQGTAADGLPGKDSVVAEGPGLLRGQKIDICHKATSGGNGENGLPGGDGGDGFNGGDSGQLIISIQENQNFRIRLYEQAGAGGFGGAGGKGQVGGKGGKAGKNQLMCMSKPKDGSAGQNGAQGKPGLDAYSGRSLEVQYVDLDQSVLVPLTF